MIEIFQACPYTTLFDIKIYFYSTSFLKSWQYIYVCHIMIYYEFSYHDVGTKIGHLTM